MPSAASVKIDKQINPENALADSSQNLTPLRQAITIIEHKIRNLEKRKVSFYSVLVSFYVRIYFTSETDVLHICFLYLFFVQIGIISEMLLTK